MGVKKKILQRFIFRKQNWIYPKSLVIHVVILNRGIYKRGNLGIKCDPTKICWGVGVDQLG